MSNPLSSRAAESLSSQEAINGIVWLNKDSGLDRCLISDSSTPFDNDSGRDPAPREGRGDKSIADLAMGLGRSSSLSGPQPSALSPKPP